MLLLSLLTFAVALPRLLSNRIRKLYVSPFAGNQTNSGRRATTAAAARGFTIIEVLIVLAIAALILLIVFLAVPALQRSQRNNARKSEAARFGAAVVEFYSGQTPPALPGTGSATDCNTVYNSLGSLSQYNGLTCSAAATNPPATPAANTFYVTSAGTAYTPTTPTAATTVILGESVQCNGAAAFGTTGVTTGRSAALLYALESGNTFAWNCLNVQ
jgi:prepilin-type N-terminal cleavage/methylation domain-containing protein